MAYVVGLLATDGCLINDGRHLNFKSEDRQLVETFLRCLGRPASSVKIAKRHRTAKVHFYAQFGDVAFYHWLESIGLMPRKSLILGAIDVPPEYLLDCARGLLDGDGSLVNNRYRGGGKAAGRTYEGFTTRFISASREHVEWLRGELRDLLGIKGGLTPASPRGGCWSISYGIRESSVLLPRIYSDESVPKLDRKWETWRSYAERHGYAATLHASQSLAFEQLPSQRDDRGRFRTLSLCEDLPAAI
jgi:hypothetical protein